MKLIKNRHSYLLAKSDFKTISAISFTFITCALLLILSGCSGSEYSPHRRSQPTAESDNSTTSGKHSESDQVTQDIPWQTWSPGLTLNQINFKDPRVESGDSLLAKSDLSGALNSYRVTKSAGTDEAESLALRIATVELLSGDAPRSVLSLSRFFQNRKQDESQISDTSALFFGYSYGQTRNYEQALAWFSQALKSKQYIVRDRAKFGLSSLLTIIPNNTLDEMDLIWKSNQEVSKFISEERSIRQRRPQIQLLSSAFFWSSQNNQSSKVDLNSTEHTTVFTNQSARKVAAILPLSGKYAKMGESVKHGLELAGELSASRGVPLEFTFKDLPGDSDLNSAGSASGSAMVDEAVAQGASVIVGPLISEQTNSVAESARKNAIPTILLAKGGSATLGEGIYRFGLTNESQANSLISAIMKFRSNPRIVLVYPSDESGTAFISAVQDAMKQFNIVPLAEYSYSKGNSAQMLAKTSDLDINPPDFVIFGDNLKAAVQFFGAISPASRKAIVPVGSALWDNPLEIMQSKTILTGAIYVSPFYPDLSKPLVSEFVARYKEKNSKTPDFFAAQGYDAGLLLSSGATVSGGAYSPPENSEGISGSTHTRGDGEILRDLSVLRLAHGTIAPITEIPAAPPISSLSDDSQAGSSGGDTLTLPPLEDSDPSIGQ